MSRPDYYANCTKECERVVDCTVCGMRKRPNGRSVPMAMENGCCGHDCPGYMQEPKPGHMWPGELEEMDAVPEVDDV